MSAELNTVRTLVSMRTRKLWVMALFIILTLVLGLSKLQHAMEILPVIGTLASTRALFRCKGLTVRCVMWCATACWVVHNFWLGSIGGTLIEGSFLVMNGLNIIRFWRMKRRESIRSKLRKACRKRTLPPDDGRGRRLVAQRVIRQTFVFSLTGRSGKQDVS